MFSLDSIAHTLSQSHTHTHRARGRERERQQKTRTLAHIKDICRKWVSQTRKQIQGQQEEERVCPITIKIYFQLFILVNPLSPASRLPPPTSLRRGAALQSEQPYNIPLLQSSVLLGLVVMCIRIHIIITHSPRCTAEGILASTQLERTEQNGTK